MQQTTSADRFGSRVRLVREARGLSQRELARLLTEAGYRIDASAITRVERGERAARLPEAVAIAAVLETTVGELLGESDAPASRRLAGLRASATSYWHSAQDALVNYGESLVEILEIVREEPELLMEEIPDCDVVGEPGESYLSWVAATLDDIRGKRTYVVTTDVRTDIEALSEILEKSGRGLVKFDPDSRTEWE